MVFATRFGEAVFAGDLVRSVRRSNMLILDLGFGIADFLLSVSVLCLLYIPWSSPDRTTEETEGTDKGAERERPGSTIEP